MATFLSKADQKKVQLIHLLLESDDALHIESIAQALSVSKKTVQLYLHEFAARLAPFPEFQLQQQENRVYLYRTDDAAVDELYLQYYRDSYNYKLIDWSFRYPKASIEDLAEEEYTSTSTIYRYARLLPEFLAPYQLEFRKSLLQLRGSENHLRAFYYFFYWESAFRDSWPFPQERSKIQLLMKKIMALSGQAWNILQERQVAFWLAITLQRKGQHFEALSSGTFAPVEFQKILQPVLPLTDIHWLYEHLTMLGFLGSQSFDALLAQFATMHSIIPALRLTERFQEVISHYFPHFPFEDNKAELYRIHYQYTNMSKGQPSLFFPIDYATVIEQEAPQAYTVLQAFLKELLQATDEPLDMLLYHYYFLFEKDGLWQTGAPFVNLCLLHDRDHSYQAWWQQEVLRRFGTRRNIRFTTEQAADLVVANYPVVTEKPLLLIRDLPTERNWQQLEHRILA